jgi:hypothetical protein
MYRLELSLKVWHAEGGDGYEQVKSISEKAEFGDDNHPEMANHLAGMVRRLFTRLKEVDEKPKKKIITPGLVVPTGAQTRKVNRIAGL